MTGADSGEARGAHPGEAAGPTIRRQLLMTLGLAAAPAMALAIALGFRFHDDAVERADRAFLDRAERAHRDWRDALVSAQAALETVAESPALRALSAARCESALSTLARPPISAEAAAVADLDGQILCASSAAGAAVLSIDPDVAAAGFGIGGVDGDLAAGPALSARLRDPDGRPLGRVIVWSSEIRAAAAGGGPAYAPAHHALLGPDGRRLAGFGADGSDWLPPAAERAALSAEGAGLVEAEAADGRRMLYAVETVGAGGVRIVSAAAAEAVRDGALLRAAAPIATPLLILLVSLATIYVGVERVVIRHLTYLTRLARAYGGGRLDLAPKRTANAAREIATLGEELRLMAKHLDERRDALERASERNEALLIEVLHRVNNNLQTVLSLVNFELRRAGTGPARGGLERMRARLRAISAVHELLYTSDDARIAPLDRIAASVAAGAAERASRAPSSILTRLDPVRETPDRAVSIALFMTETLDAALEAAGDRTVRLDVAAGSEGVYEIGVFIDAGARAAELPPDPPDGPLLAALAQRVRGELRRERGRRLSGVTLRVPPEGGAGRGGDPATQAAARDAGASAEARRYRVTREPEAKAASV